MYSCNRTNNAGRVLPIASALTVGLLFLVFSPEAFAEKRLAQAKPQFSRAGAYQVSTTPGSQAATDIGIDDWLVQERIVFISGEIDAEVASSVIAQMLYLDHKSPGKDIYLYINSPGGEVTAGLAIYDTMRSLQSNIVTVGLGEASSMASFLLASGTKGKRVASPHTRVMIHQPWSGVEGQASDIAIAAKEILYHRSLLNRLLSELTGQPLKRIELDTDRDFYMSAEEAKAYGIVDRTSTQLPSATRPLK